MFDVEHKHKRTRNRPSNRTQLLIGFFEALGDITTCFSHEKVLTPESTYLRVWVIHEHKRTGHRLGKRTQLLIGLLEALGVKVELLVIGDIIGHHRGLERLEWLHLGLVRQAVLEGKK